MHRSWRFSAVAAIFGVTACALGACGTEGGGGGEPDEAGFSDSPSERDGAGDGTATTPDSASETGESDGAGDVWTSDADGSGGGDATVADASNDAAEAAVDVVVPEAAAEAGDSAVGVDGAAGVDGGGADAALDAGHDASPPDAGTDAADSGRADTGSPADAGCIAPTPDMFSCAGSCNGATSYCVGGAIPNACETLPAECACAQNHSCACLLAHAPAPCTGTIACTAYDDGGQLWLFASNCH